MIAAAHAAHRRPAAGRSLLGRRHLRGRRHRHRHARAAQGRPHARRRHDRHRPDARRDRRRPSRRRPARTSSGPSSDPSRRPAAWPSCAAASRPDGCVIKLAGHERRQFSGPARVFDSEHACFAGRQATSASAPATSSSSATRAPSAGPACRRCSRVTGAHRGRGPRRVGGAADRRPLQRRHARPDDRPRRARGGARRPHRARRGGRHDHASTSTGARSISRSTRRRWPSAGRAGGAPAPRYRTGVLAKYAALVSSASEGAVTDPA